MATLLHERQARQTRAAGGRGARRRHPGPRRSRRTGPWPRSARSSTSSSRRTRRRPARPHASIHLDLRRACGGPELAAATSEQVLERVDADPALVRRPALTRRRRRPDVHRSAGLSTRAGSDAGLGSPIVTHTDRTSYRRLPSTAAHHGSGRRRRLFAATDAQAATRRAADGNGASRSAHRDRHHRPARQRLQLELLQQPDLQRPAHNDIGVAKTASWSRRSGPSAATDRCITLDAGDTIQGTRSRTTTPRSSRSPAGASTRWPPR